MKCAAVLAIDAALLAIACGRSAPIASCRDDLRGVYVAGDERWMMLDHGATLEAYPLFPDNAGARALRGTEDEDRGGRAKPELRSSGDDDRGGRAKPDVVVAPRVIDLERTAGAVRLAGTLGRRYMLRAERCDARVPVHVTRCAGDTLELVLGDPAPPLSFAPCTWPRPDPSRVERWRRE